MEEKIKSEKHTNKKCDRILKIMKISSLMLFCCFFTITAGNVYSQQKDLSLNLRNVTLKKAISEIEKTSDYVFLITDDAQEELNREISIKAKKKSIQTILDNIFSDTNLGYKTIERQILVYKNRNPEKIVKSEEIAKMEQQKRTITGKVTDEKGENLIGANIMEIGTTNGTVTDTNGNFSLSITPDASIKVSYIGYISQEINTKGKTIFSIVLKEDAGSLEELVVVGYGIQKKSDITGSISSVPMNLIKNQPIRDLSDILSGRVAGVVLSRTSGDIGENSKLRIRGANSIIGNNAPLYVVDGVIGGSVGSIHDIASIEVLKDASATAIYGERASNGVILITTKKAASEKPEIKLILNTGFISPKTRYPDMMTAAEYATYLNDFHESDIYSSADIKEFERTGGTNWPDMVLQTGVKRDYNLSYSQKMSKIGVYLSARYSDEQGVMINSRAGDNYSLRSSVDFTPNDRLSFNLDIKAGKYKSKNGGMSTSINKSHPLMQALIWSPTEPVWDDEENKQYHVRDRYGALLENPYMIAMETNRFGIGKWANATFIGNYKITDWLTYNITGYAANGSNQGGYYNNKWLRPTDPNAGRDGGESSTWRLINRLDFNKTFKDAHHLMISGVYEAESGEGYSMWSNVRNMPLPDVAQYYSIGISNIQEANSGYWKSSRVGYLGRLNYNYKSRYYFTASYRVDGRSGPVDRPKENKFGAFPSVALSWRLSEEPFMKGGFFDNLKFRFGWGKTGNPSNFQYTTMARKDHNFGLGANLIGYVPGTPANPKVKWETTEQTDFGVNFTILKGKLSATLDYFNKKTTDLLTRLNLPAYYGYGKDASYTQNMGEINNKGFEATIDYIPIQTSTFFWGINFNLSSVRNKVISLGDQDAFMAGGRGNGLMEDEAYRIDNGLSLGTMWGFKYLGIWKTDQEAEALKYGSKPGDIRFEDVNGDGAINLADDGQKIGDANPDFVWGFTNSISWKNFDFNITLQGMHGQNVFNLMRAIMSIPHPDSRAILLKDPAFNYWTPERQDTEWPNIHSTSNVKKLNSSQWIEDGSWVKIKNIGITYTIPKKIIRFADMSVTLSGSDLFTFTKYKGFDPEVSASGGSDLFGGMDFGTLPIPRTVTLGLSLVF